MDFEGIIQILQAEAPYSFAYSDQVVDNNIKINFTADSIPLNQILDTLCHYHAIDYIKIDSKILFVKKYQIESKKEKKNEEIFGFVRDKETNEILAGATIYSFHSGRGTYANKHGFFTYQFFPIDSMIIVSHIGYLPQSFYASQTKGRQDIYLEANQYIPEILIRPDWNDKTAMWENNYQNFTSDPNIYGHEDAINSLRKMPSIQSGMEQQGTLHIRGGTNAQNLYLMDGVPIYEANHLLGLSSIFAKKAINSIDLCTNAFDAKYGGRLSGIIDVGIKGGNLNSHNQSVNLGLMGTSIHLEGPISQSKLSYNLTARKSYFQNFLKSIANKYLNIENILFKFSDFILKTNYQINNKSAISLTTFLSNDKIGFEENRIQSIHADTIEHLNSISEISWSNKLACLNYTNAINKNIFIQGHASILQYNLHSRSIKNITYKSQMNSHTNAFDVFAVSRIIDRNLRFDMEYQPRNKHKLKFGIGTTFHSLSPTLRQSQQIVKNWNPKSFLDSIKINTNNSFLYLSDEYVGIRNVKLRLGAHFSRFQNNNIAYFRFQPRLSLQYYFQNNSMMSLSYDRMNQNIHQLTNNGLGLPTDLWLPSNKLVKPMSCDQFGLEWSLRHSNKILFSIASYYKKFSNLIDYKQVSDLHNPVINENQIPIFNDTKGWEDRIGIGSGRSYGANIYLQYTDSVLVASASYMWAKADRSFESINMGKRFPAKYDRRHDFNISMTYHISPRWTTGIDFAFGSGHRTTLALTEFEDPDGFPILDYSDRNNFQLPDYHRLDINTSYTKNLKFMTIKSTIGIYNLYNRKNVYFIYLYKEKENRNYSLKKVSLLPILPILNFEFQF